MSSYNSLKQMSDYMQKKQNESVVGIFNDSGIGIPLPQTVASTDFDGGVVNFSKPIPANQLVMAGSFAKYEGDKFTKTITHSGDQRAMDLERMREQNALKLKKLDESGSNYRANLPYEKAKIGTQAAQQQVENFGNLIYGVNAANFDIDRGKKGDIKNVQINQGVIVNAKGDKVDYSGEIRLPANNFDNSIITEYNKYVGAGKINPDGSSTQVNEPSKLYTQDGKYTVRMKNGEIDGIKAEDGTFVTVPQFQHITLTAGQKGSNKYIKPDPNYGKFDNTKPSGAKSGAMSDEEYNNFLKKNGLK